MAFLLDTNVVSNLRRKRPHPGLLAWLASIDRDSVFMSAPTVTELQCGMCMTSDMIKAADVQVWLDGLLRGGFPAIVPFDGGLR